MGFCSFPSPFVGGGALGCIASVSVKCPGIACHFVAYFASVVPAQILFDCRTFVVTFGGYPDLSAQLDRTVLRFSLPPERRRSSTGFDLSRVLGISKSSCAPVVPESFQAELFLSIQALVYFQDLHGYVLVPPIDDFEFQ